MADKIWKKFERSLTKLVSGIDSSVLKKLKSNFVDAPANYLMSNEFEIVMNDTIEKISYDKLKIYIHLLELKKSLRTASKLKRKVPIESEVAAKKRKQADDNLILAVKEEEDFLDYYNGCPTTTTNNIEVQPQPDENQSKIEKFIAKLEAVLESTKIEIQKLEEDELSLDDLDKPNNSFMMLDKLKAHSVKVWRKICKLQNTNSKLHRRVLKTFSFKGTIYPALNTKIEEVVKEKKFPDYNDIKAAVVSHINEGNIKMSGQKMSHLAVDIFTQIGNQLKKKRITDFVNYFGNHLTDQVKLNENPILSDDNLRRILLRNHVAGQIKMDEVLDKYSKMEQGYTDKADENASDISTEHTDISDNDDDIEENLDNLNVDELRQQTGMLNELDADDTDDDAAEPGDKTPLVASTLNSTPVAAPALAVDAPTETVAASHAERAVVAVTTIVDDVPTLPEKDPEIEIKEMEAHTFRFNVDQLRQGEQGTIYASTITINSSDDSDSSDNADNGSNGEVEDNHFAYSSKLDDFLVARPRIVEIVDTGICISIDDSDDEVGTHS